MRSAFVGALALLAAACTPPARLAQPAELVLLGSDAKRHDLGKDLRTSRFTVFVFAAQSCGYLDAHAPRLRELFESFAPRGVAFRLVDSEVGGNRARAAALVRRGGYAFPALVDEHARLAEALGADFAGHTVVVDAAGEIRYSGGIDSDATRLREDAKRYLGDALTDLLDGKPPRLPRSEALGCALELH